jgi:hypothetical protein
VPSSLAKVAIRTNAVLLGVFWFTILPKSYVTGIAEVATGDRLKTIRLDVLFGWMLKPVSPAWFCNAADDAEKPAGGVQGVPTKGVLKQYSNSIEPTALTLAIVKVKRWEVAAPGKDEAIVIVLDVNGSA